MDGRAEDTSGRGLIGRDRDSVREGVVRPGGILLFGTQLNLVERDIVVKIVAPSSKVDVECPIPVLLQDLCGVPTAPPANLHNLSYFEWESSETVSPEEGMGCGPS
jgi:hypothetical protein